MEVTHHRDGLLHALALCLGGDQNERYDEQLFVCAHGLQQLHARPHGHVEDVMPTQTQSLSGHAGGR